MAMITETHAGVSSEQGLFARLAEKFVAGYSRYATYKRTVAELSMLNDRELRDFGANRSMIRSMAYEQAYRSM
ncbi:hypothetical protein ATO6_16360 [Oceanicola sp. 22II-s10i]|uniref:DUF1127 domain-containing protein n=1 Tax=Oceanicola sp. 22II-s10i TaxID=1317116 RepID=UPI000B521630|nr:DUF1127 domain-containing protein [Oceanicola sp. 22II-s10i]OWU83976.1 hypothetical protein ATO6_16360 [Oceanicola sp. 22II-s10i]